MTANELTRRERYALALLLVLSLAIAWCVRGTIISAYVSVWDVVRAPFTHAQSTTVHVPVRMDTHDEHPVHVVTVPACEQEDASGAHDGPICRWDADTDGLANGGYSYWAVHLDSCRVQFQYDRLPWETVNEC